MEDPAARRARLKALREAAQAAEAAQEQPQAEQQQQEEVVLKFRNYNPVNDKQVVHEKVRDSLSLLSV